MLIKNLSFKFDKNSSHYFFKNLSIECAPNALHFIQGENGIGKSTLFNIMQGNINAEAFLEITIQLDKAIYSADKNRLPFHFTQQVHTIQQQYDHMIADKFTFIENLQLAHLPRYPTLKSLPQATLFDIITSMNIDTHKPVHFLSGGQRQLLAILMALQKPTKILLLDEPTATLDQKNARLIIECLQKLAAQLHITMFAICHDKDLVKQYAQGNVFIMEKHDDEERILKPLVIT